MKGRNFLAAVALLILAGCTSEEDIKTIDAWLVCDDCVELRSEVAGMGIGVVSHLADALAGPSPGAMERYRRQFTALYGLVPSPGLSESEYVGLHLENLRAGYQLRAATSLGDIAGDCFSLVCQRLALKALVLALEQDSTIRDQTGSGLFRADVGGSIKVEIGRASAV